MAEEKKSFEEFNANYFVIISIRQKYNHFNIIINLALNK